MIRRVTLENWRAYDQLELTLDRGTTFIVARNGVGKTSLMQAVAYALYGEAGLPNPLSAVRAGKQSARVEVTVELADSGVLRIARTVATRRNQTQVDAWLDGKPLHGDDELAGLLASSMGADPDFLARSTFVQEGTVQREAETSFSLYQHLCNVYGISNLLAASDELARIRKAAEKGVTGVRQSLARSKHELDMLRARAEAARTAAEQSDAELELAQTSFDAAEDALSRANARQRWEAQDTERGQLLAELVADAQRLTGRPVTVDALSAVLDQSEAAAYEAIDNTRRRRAEAAGRVKAIRSSLALLSAADGVCPVCRRPLSSTDAIAAHAQHEEEIAAIEQGASDLNDTPHLELVEAVHALRRRLAAVPAKTAEPAGVDADVTQILDAARSRLQTAKRQAILKHEEHAVLAGQLEEAEQHDLRRRELEAAFRREALVITTADAVRKAAEQVIRDSIRPLADEIAWRWKRMFGDRGTLDLRPDGTVVLRRGQHEVPFHDFSAGERMIAVLLVRMTALTASTRANFFWVDEPLEHLDPTYRLAVASMLTQASASPALQQVVVTTYEERIAEQIAANSDHASVRFVTTAAS
jgi:DNA repair exonuclease SbcCD ATPase subunit